MSYGRLQMHTQSTKLSSPPKSIKNDDFWIGIQVDFILLNFWFFVFFFLIKKKVIYCLRFTLFYHKLNSSTCIQKTLWRWLFSHEHVVPLLPKFIFPPFFLSSYPLISEDLVSWALSSGCRYFLFLILVFFSLRRKKERGDFCNHVF